MRVFITGATGFIGTHVLNELDNRGTESLILSRSEMDGKSNAKRHFIKGSLKNILSLKEQIAIFAPDVVIHLAWEGIPDYSYSMSEKNLRYGLDLLHLCGEIGCKKVIMTGSCWEYENPSGLVAENAPLSCENGFKAAKNSLRVMGEAFCRESGITFQWLRLFYVYGEGQKPSSLIPSIIRSIQNGKQPRLNTPYNKLDYIYVKDVAACIAHMATEYHSSDVINVGSGVMTENLDILKVVADKLDFALDLSGYKQDDRHDVEFGADSVRLSNLGFKPLYSIDDGISEIIRIFTFKI